MNTKSLSDFYSNWSQLAEQKSAWQNTTLQSLFDADSNRAERYSVSAAGLELDYSKNHLDEKALSLLFSVAEQADVAGAIKKLLRGDHVNATEDRPALHSALRFEGQAKTDEQKSVSETLEKMSKLINSVYSGTWKGHSGKVITDVVNIGIGGSDLGPRMVTKALTPFHNKKVNVHFVANIDGAEISDLCAFLNPESTLFIVASKSFSTLETLQNALTARQWVLNSGCSHEQLAKHFVAISSKVDKAIEFGIDADNIYPIWDWVGGRYSLWSAIGLPIAFAIGMDNFQKLLAGAASMDSHFAEAPLERNIPVLMALIVFWYSNVMGSNTQAVLPYSYHLQLLPAYLQQLEMESNGKSTTRTGDKLDYQTGSIVWGTEGTNGQHSFHQLLHQGTITAPIDFIATLKAHHSLDHQHKFLFANCVAQSQALMAGRDLETSKAELESQGLSEEEIAFIAPHKVHPGNRPSTTIVMDALTPETLGALVAAYEHKTYTLGVLWNINSFDQWGVELGKLLGTHVTTAIDTTDIPTDWDSSTRKLIQAFNDANKKF
ncbi:glucose-6-phosphate isomerase [Agarilytica rhodophyticola]|uniref:glucose-6-phosphate isomerase n=1 Tax=Agarilytica rhodophyticola TaxID=1737490 RepID=UPI000B345475|nr:glucose-6-phosphate isomerase [Agarilytica rhodophyticola]